jgi:hypothetical protein
MDNVVEKKTVRKYRRITPNVIARFKAEQAVQGNGSAAIRILEPDYMRVGDRAYEISKVTEGMSADEYLDKSIEQIAVKAIARVERIVNSKDEHVALKASTFVIEQRRGKAVQKNESRSVNINIETVLQ